MIILIDEVLLTSLIMFFFNDNFFHSNFPSCIICLGEEYDERINKSTLCLCSLTESGPFIALLYESSDEVNVVLQHILCDFTLLIL